MFSDGSAIFSVRIPPAPVADPAAPPAAAAPLAPAAPETPAAPELQPDKTTPTAAAANNFLNPDMVIPLAQKSALTCKREFSHKGITRCGIIHPATEKAAERRIMPSSNTPRSRAATPKLFAVSAATLATVRPTPPGGWYS
jgi:hypothetical protein